VIKCPNCGKKSLVRGSAKRHKCGDHTTPPLPLIIVSIRKDPIAPQDALIKLIPSLKPVSVPRSLSPNAARLALGLGPDPIAGATGPMGVTGATGHCTAYAGVVSDNVSWHIRTHNG
jgi:hypothetical protein